MTHFTSKASIPLAVPFRDLSSSFLFAATRVNDFCLVHRKPLWSLSGPFTLGELILFFIWPIYKTSIVRCLTSQQQSGSLGLGAKTSSHSLTQESARKQPSREESGHYVLMLSSCQSSDNDMIEVNILPTLKHWLCNLQECR